MIKRKREQDIPHLTADETKILMLGKDDPSIITDYFFRPRGTKKGWVFDENFTEDGKWQKSVHLASQTDIIVIGGFGSGKTAGIGMSAFVWCMTTFPDFKFLNAAPTAKQAKLMYEYILKTAKGTRAEDFIFSAPESPYPTIDIKFWIGETLVENTLEFMSIADDANNILGWEGDWLNIDESFLIDDLEYVMSIVGSRVRGSIQGRERLGRISQITNSHDNEYGWYLWDLAISSPEDNLSIVVSSRHNKNVTLKQLARMLARIPVDERERYVDGLRPEGRGNYFSKESIHKCESAEYGQQIRHMMEDDPAYILTAVSGAGVIYMQTPYIKGHIYVVIGDPGTDNAPKRNSPVLSVWDCTDFPAQPASLVSFWWGSGNGSITPFAGMLLRYMLTYKPVKIGIDSTGPQKTSAEILNIYFKSDRIDNQDILKWLGNEVDKTKPIRMPKSMHIDGMDFSGSKKSSYLVIGRVFLEAMKLIWPKDIAGIRSQLSNYDPMKDKAGQPKIPQDIVSVICMAAYAISIFFNYNPLDFETEEVEESTSEHTYSGSRSSQRSGGRGSVRTPR